ncbi:MAG: DUF4410 domain-containing protein [Methylosarcina sp.]
MKSRLLTVISCLGVVLLITGCASTQVTTSPEFAATGQQLPRPARIWVYDFVPASSSANASLQAEIGREIASGLVSSIRQMGLPVEQGSPTTTLQLNDLVLKGNIVSMDEGSTEKRVAIGFGSGGSELKVQVEGYQVTPQGLRRVGGGTGEAGGSKTPGAALGTVGAIATGNPAGLIISTGMKVYGEASGSSKVEGRTQQIVEEITERLRTRFQQEGWIQ